MIEKRIQMFVDFRVICNGCGRAAPAAPLEIEALYQAQDAGFRRSDHWNKQKHTGIHLCPYCQERKAAFMEARKIYLEAKEQKRWKDM